MHTRGWRIGQVFILEDVTQMRQAQELQTEMLWAQATLEERKQLAWELHDGLSQSLAFLNLQAQAALVQIQAGKSQDAQASLDRMIEAAGQIQENTREMIGNLLTVDLPAKNFNATLLQILSHFEQQTGLAVHLEMVGDGGKAADSFFAQTKLPPLATAQLIPIIQEALVNVRKHAVGASQVSVRLKASDGRLFLTIKDDGAGFDQAAQRNHGEKFGLQVMRQRAARIGAQIAIDSAPGKGTRIEICAPLADCEAGGGE
jgi:two-component system, NarL family, nitrate/nitrite sensor histidine kinase NarX